MSRTPGFSVGILALVAVTAGCGPRQFRQVDPTHEKWKAELANYPRVEADIYQKFAPRRPEDVAVFYYLWKGRDMQKWAKIGEETNPPAGLLVLADLAVFRGPEPDHDGALWELRRMAADLGADTLMHVLYTVVVGTKYMGGTELVGWIYKGRAARRREETR